MLQGKGGWGFVVLARRLHILCLCGTSIDRAVIPGLLWPMSGSLGVWIGFLWFLLVVLHLLIISIIITKPCPILSMAYVNINNKNAQGDRTHDPHASILFL